MTGPVVPSDEDELRAALVGKLDASMNPNENATGWMARHLADALLPIVLADRERYADQRAAEELRAAATAARGMHDPPAPDCVEWADWLNARADALTREATTHRYDPDTQRCTCGALDHPDWGVTA